LDVSKSIEHDIKNHDEDSEHDVEDNGEDGEDNRQQW